MKHLGNLLFGLYILVEVEQLATKIVHHVHFSKENFVQFFNVGLHIASRLIYFLENFHFFFDYLDRLLAARIVLKNELLFFLQDLLDQLLVLLAQGLKVPFVLYFQFIESRNSISELLRFLRSLWLFSHPELSLVTSIYCLVSILVFLLSEKALAHWTCLLLLLQLLLV